MKLSLPVRILMSLSARADTVSRNLALSKVASLIATT